MLDCSKIWFFYGCFIVCSVFEAFKVSLAVSFNLSIQPYLQIGHGDDDDDGDDDQHPRLHCRHATRDIFPNFGTGLGVAMAVELLYAGHLLPPNSLFVVSANDSETEVGFSAVQQTCLTTKT